MSVPERISVGHPVTKVVTRRLAKGYVVVCAGGAAISVHSSASLLSRHSTRTNSETISSQVEQFVDELEHGEEPVKQADARATLEAGAVASLAVALLPGGEAALALIGTTVGTLALFLLDGPLRLFKIAEVPLLQWSNGVLSGNAVIHDVAVSMDPAGRPEFAAACSGTCVLLVDIQDLYRTLEEEYANGMPDTSVFNHHHHHEAVAALRARAVEAIKKHHPAAQYIQRSRSEPLTFALTGAADVVRLLPPQRYNAAAAMDVALVLVLADGTLRYVERVVTGGSVRLLEEQHQLRQTRGDQFTNYEKEGQLYQVRTSSYNHHNHNNNSSQAEMLLMDPTAAPHVVYSYRLSPISFQVCDAATAAAKRENGFSTAFSSSASSRVSHAQPESSNIVVNDADIYFSEAHGCCHVALVGSQFSPLRPTPSSTTATTTTTVLSTAAQTRLGQTAPSLLRDGGHELRGWWAVARQVVLPRCTLDRPRLEQELKWDASHHNNNNNNFGISPFMIHVQSGAAALAGGGSRAVAGGAAPKAALGVGFAAVAVRGGQQDREEDVFATAGRTLYRGRVAASGTRSAVLPEMEVCAVTQGSVMSSVALGTQGAEGILIGAGSHLLYITQ